MLKYSVASKSCAFKSLTEVKLKTNQQIPHGGKWTYDIKHWIFNLDACVSSILLLHKSKLIIMKFNLF